MAGLPLRLVAGLAADDDNQVPIGEAGIVSTEVQDVRRDQIKAGDGQPLLAGQVEEERLRAADRQVAVTADAEVELAAGEKSKVKLRSPGRPRYPATVRAPLLPIVKGFELIAKRSGTSTENSAPVSVAASAEPAMPTARATPTQSLVNNA